MVSTGSPVIVNTLTIVKGKKQSGALPGNSADPSRKHRHAGESRHPGGVVGLNPGFRRDDGGSHSNYRAKPLSGD